MAKKKAEQETIDKPGEVSTDERVEKTLLELERMFGRKLNKSGKEILEEKEVIIPFSPSLDVGLGGGIPEGSWVSISGPPKHGKTTSCLSFAANAQLEKYGRRPVFFLVPEHRLKQRDLRGIEGLDTDPRHFERFASDTGYILTSKEWLKTAGMLVTNIPTCVVIIDSISAMCSPSLMDGGIGTSDHGKGYQLISQFCDMYCSTVKINKCIVIGIVHYYSNTTGQGPKNLEKAASRWKYQADVAMAGKYASPWRANENDTDSPQLGQTMEWIVKTTATDAPPGSKLTSYMRYGVGIDKVYEAMLLGKDVGLIEQAGSWYGLPFLSSRPELIQGTEWEKKGEVKVQGAEKAYSLIKRNVAWREALMEAVSGITRGPR